ncbi:hypothetical protein QSE00_14450 [Arenibacter sp. M-2]|uniref:hypothetical protein n=1 Tax=unclassified Arenibacter TaxID=2615047 RepID=UPI000D7554B3|nr:MULTISPECIES: hypothetical protein [unclassified Arenibacter]MDL5513024.1 hypothetical protein [Arenibacter sp. M-2]|tara:strand:- start:8851 stop:9036 length:186 start_codon:yes stop_codon:yes gene_type:complete
MTKRTTNILGIVIAILAGTYFNIMLCNNCSRSEGDPSAVENSEVIVKNSPVIKKNHINNPN